jgi:hypothetical protein
MRLLTRRRPGRPRAARTALTLTGCLAITAVAGCAVVPAPSPHAHSTRTGTGVTSTSPPSSAGTPKQRAIADADLMLKAFAPPAGAREVSGSPVPGSVMSRSPATPTPEDDDVVTETSWWLAPGDPQQVLIWEKAHIPSLYRYFGGGTTGSGVWNDVFSIPAVPGLFDTRELAVSTTTAGGGGQTAIRVDALVDWIPVRPAGDTVPATARVAKLVETRSGFGGTPPKQATTVIAAATVTDPAQVAALAAYLNGLAVNPPGAVWSCPAFSGDSTVTLTFSARPGAPVLAMASAELDGCAFLSYTMPGQPATGLGGGAAGENLLDEVNHVTGLHWKIPVPAVP